MNVYFAEFIGTAILILMGNGVVANVVLNDTKGSGGGWIVISAGWGFAVYTAVLCVGEFSGAHINPAVTVALAGTFPKPIKLGPRAVGWIEAEIEAHNQACIKASRSGHSE